MLSVVGVICANGLLSSVPTLSGSSADPPNEICTVSRKLSVPMSTNDM